MHMLASVRDASSDAAAFGADGQTPVAKWAGALSAALLAAMMSDRAFVIRWRTPAPLTDYLVPTVFNWDAEEVLLRLPEPVLADAVYLSTGAG